MVSKFYGVVVGIGLLVQPVLGLAQPNRPQVVPESRINVRFYDVNSVHSDQLAHAVTQSAPKMNGKPVLGKASYQVDWQLDTEQRSGRCQLNRVTVTTNATVLLPRWRQSANSSDPVRQRWGQLLSSMFDYESRFKERVLQGAHQIGAVIASLPDHSDCQALRYAAWVAGSGELNKIRGRLDELQRQSGYGEQLGVLWPK